MNRDYKVGDIVLASDLALSAKGEVVQLVDGKIINPAGYCFNWARAHGQPGLWMPVDSIIRHATTEEVIAFAGEQETILKREIEFHMEQVRKLTERLEEIGK